MHSTKIFGVRPKLLEVDSDKDHAMKNETKEGDPELWKLAKQL